MKLKLLNIKKSVAVLTTACFLFTMVFSQGAYAIVTPAPLPVINQNTLKSIESYLLPFNIGRITDALYTGSDEVVINIQDLHSHAQAQRNISSILSILDTQYGLENVYVEGGIGQVDTSWLSSISNKELREKILNNMLESGRLTGGEYYSVETNKNKLLKGIEDRDTYINNLKRLDEFYSKKQDILKYVSFLKYTLNNVSKKYYTRDNLKLNRVVSKHEAGNLSAQKYFTYLLETANKANINLKRYPNIIAFLQVLKKQEGLDTKKVNLAIAELLNELKVKLSYEQYQALISKISNKSKETEFYFDLYKTAKENGLLEKSDYKILLVFFDYLSLNQSLNPVNLTLDEQNLLQELNIKLSKTQNEKDIYFLQNYLGYFSGYLTNKLTASDYEYFINNMARFRLLWEKYVDIDGIIELDSYFSFFGDFYKDNVERNRYFIKNIMGKMPDEPKEGLRIKSNINHAQNVLDELSKTKKVKVVITGGFHTYGFTKLLQDNNINYIVITPNVIKQTVNADVLFEDVFREQSSALYNTLQKMLVSQLGGVDSILNSDVLEALDSTKLTSQAISILNKALADKGQSVKVVDLQFGKDENNNNKVIAVLNNGTNKEIVLKSETEQIEKETSVKFDKQNKADFETFDRISNLSKQIRELNRTISNSDNYAQKEEKLLELQNVVENLRKEIEKIDEKSSLKDYADQFKNMDKIFGKENIVLIGPSGSGKSTTAKLVAETAGAEIISFDKLIREYLVNEKKLNEKSEEYKKRHANIKNGIYNSETEKREIINRLEEKINDLGGGQKIFVDGFGRTVEQIDILKDIFELKDAIFVYVERSGEDALEIGRQKQIEAGHADNSLPVEDERAHWNANPVLNKLQNDGDIEFVHITKDNIIPSSLIASFAVRYDDRKMVKEYGKNEITKEETEKLDKDVKLINKFLDNQNGLTVDEEKYFQEEVSKAQGIVKFGTAGHRELIINEDGIETFNPFVVFVLTDAYAEYINEHNELPKRMFVGYDTRYMGDRYTDIVSKTFSKYGITVDMPNTYLSTPAISNWVKNNSKGTKYAGSVNITASHNPGNYNGYKVNGPLGDPYGSNVTDEISEYAKDGTRFEISAIKARMLQAKDGKVNKIDVDEFRTSHVDNAITIIQNMLGKKDVSLLPGTNVIFDANHSALELEVKRLFKELKSELKNILNSGRDVVFEKEGLDAGKSPEPNEKNSEQLKAALEKNVDDQLAELKKEGKLTDKQIKQIELTNFAITTDPDGDRFGMYYAEYNKDKENFEVKFATPDEMGAVVQFILLESLIKNLKAAKNAGKLSETWLQENGFPVGLVKSADTTDQFNLLAEAYKTEIKDILEGSGLSDDKIAKFSEIKIETVDIGYKNLADAAKTMVKNGINPVILLESSGGLVAGLSDNTGTYDKDGLVANMLPIVLLQNMNLTFATVLKEIEELTGKKESLGRTKVAKETEGLIALSKKLTFKNTKSGKNIPTDDNVNVVDAALMAIGNIIINKSADKKYENIDFSKDVNLSKFVSESDINGLDNDIKEQIEKLLKADIFINPDTSIANGFEIRFYNEKGYSLIVRASGTEPAIRIYTKTLTNTEEIVSDEQFKGQLQLTTIKDGNGNDVLHFNVNENLIEEDGLKQLKEDTQIRAKAEGRNVITSPFVELKQNEVNKTINKLNKDIERTKISKDKKITVVIGENSKLATDAEAFLSLSGNVDNIELIEKTNKTDNVIDATNYSTDEILTLMVLLTTSGTKEAKEVINYAYDLANSKDFENIMYQALYASEISGTTVEKFNAYYPGVDGLRNYLFKIFKNRDTVVTEGPQLQHSIGQSMMAAVKSFFTHKKSKYSSKQHNQFSLPWYIIPMETQIPTEIGTGHLEEYTVNKNNNGIGLFPVEKNPQSALLMMILFGSVAQNQQKKEKTGKIDVDGNKYAKEVNEYVTENSIETKITSTGAGVSATFYSYDNIKLNNLINKIANNENIKKFFRKLRRGGVVNPSEDYKGKDGRPANHHVLENIEFDGKKFIKVKEDLTYEQNTILNEHINTLNRMLELLNKWDNEGIESIVFNGIGGSELGPRMLVELLESMGVENYFKNIKDIRFISSPNDESFINVIEGKGSYSGKGALAADKTAVVGMSKSGTTLETVTNMEKLLNWKQENAMQFNISQIAYVSDKDDAIKNSLSKIGITLSDTEFKNYKETNKFGFDDSIGGRWSWISAIGMAVVAFSPEAFSQIVAGARSQSQSLNGSFNDIAIALALSNIKGTQIDGSEIQYIKLTVQGDSKVIPLPQFVEWYKQLIEESNGKGTDIEGNILDKISSCQSVEFTDGSQKQADLNIVIGKKGTVKQDKNAKYNLVLEHNGTPVGMLNSFGALINIFEQTVEVEGYMRNINSFDQPAVQAAKDAAKAISKKIEQGLSDKLNPMVEILGNHFKETQNTQLDLGLFGNIFENKSTLRALFVATIESFILVPVIIIDAIEGLHSGNIGRAGKWFLNLHKHYTDSEALDFLKELTELNPNDKETKEKYENAKEINEQMEKGFIEIRDNTFSTGVFSGIIILVVGLFVGRGFIADPNLAFMSFIATVIAGIIATFYTNINSHSIYNIKNPAAPLFLGKINIFRKGKGQEKVKEKNEESKKEIIVDLRGFYEEKYVEEKKKLPQQKEPKKEIKGKNNEAEIISLLRAFRYGRIAIRETLEKPYQEIIVEDILNPLIKEMDEQLRVIEKYEIDFEDISLKRDLKIKDNIIYFTYKGFDYELDFTNVDDKTEINTLLDELENKIKEVNAEKDNAKLNLFSADETAYLKNLEDTIKMYKHDTVALLNFLEGKKNQERSKMDSPATNISDYLESYVMLSIWNSIDEQGNITDTTKELVSLRTYLKNIKIDNDKGISELKEYIESIKDTKIYSVEKVKEIKENIGKIEQKWSNQSAQLDLGLFSNMFADKPTLRAIFVGFIEIPIIMFLSSKSFLTNHATYNKALEVLEQNPNDEESQKIKGRMELGVKIIKYGTILITSIAFVSSFAFVGADANPIYNFGMAIVKSLVSFVLSGAGIHAGWNILNPNTKLDITSKYKNKIESPFNNIEKYIENNPKAEGVEDLKKLIAIKPNISNMYVALAEPNDEKQIYDLTKNNKTENNNVIYDYGWITSVLSKDYEQLFEYLEKIEDTLPKEIVNDIDKIYNYVANVEESGFMGIEMAVNSYKASKNNQDKELAKRALLNMQDSINKRINDIEQGNKKVDAETVKILRDYESQITQIVKFETIEELINIYNDETKTYVEREAARRELDEIKGTIDTDNINGKINSFKKFNINREDLILQLNIDTSKKVTIRSVNKDVKDSIEDFSNNLKKKIDEFYSNKAFRNEEDYENYKNFIENTIIPIYIESKIGSRIINYVNYLDADGLVGTHNLNIGAYNIKTEEYYDNVANKILGKDQKYKNDYKDFDISLLSTEELTAMLEIVDRGILKVKENKLNAIFAPGGRNRDPIMRDDVLKQARTKIRQEIEIRTLKQVILDEIRDKGLRKEIEKAKTREELDEILVDIAQTDQDAAEKIISRLDVKKTLADIDGEELEGKTIGLVLDLNVPIMNGKITDYTRIDATLKTIKYLTDRGAKVVAMSHHGRPKGWETKESLEIVAKGIEDRAKEILNYDLNVKFPKVLLKEQTYSNYLNSDVMKNAVQGMNNGDVLLLENLRFDDRYSSDNKADMADQFVDKLGLDGVVFDAFGVSHRNNFIRDMITTVNTKEIGALTGFLVEKELSEFAKVETPKHPFVAILGGSKVSDKIGVIENLLDKMTKGDTIVIGGAMAYTFLKAQGHEIGSSLVEDDRLELANSLQAAADKKGVRLLLPVDHVVASGLDFENEANNKAESNSDINIPKDKMGVDIGPKTVEEIKAVLEKVGKNDGTIVWNGPSGVFEIPAFAQGTFAVAKAVAEATDNGAFSMIGGGDSVAAANQAGVSERISHISTGGGASLNLLEGNVSPLIEVIPSNFQKEIDILKNNLGKKEQSIVATAAKKADAFNLYDNSFTQEQKREFEEDGLASVRNGETVIAIPAAGDSSRMQAKQAGEHIKGLEGKQVLSKGGVPISADGDTFLGFKVENAVKFLKEIEEQAVKQNLDTSKIKNNTIMIMTTSVYYEEQKEIVDEILEKYDYKGKVNIVFFNQDKGSVNYATVGDVRKMKDKYDDEDEYYAALYKAYIDGGNEAERAPLGHGEFWHQAIGKGVIAGLPKTNRYMFVSNVDNVAALSNDIMLQEIGLLKREGAGALMEVSPNAPGLAGGGFIKEIIDGKDYYRQYEFQANPDVKKSEVFNDAVGVFDLNAVREVYESGVKEDATLEEIADNGKGKFKTYPAIKQRKEKEKFKIEESKIKEKKNEDKEDKNELTDEELKRILELKSKGEIEVTTCVEKTESSLWGISCVPEFRAAVTLVGNGSKIDSLIKEGKDYSKLSDEEKKEILKEIRFLGTKQWELSDSTLENLKNELNEILPVDEQIESTNDMRVLLRAETYSGNKQIINDYIEYVRSGDLVSTDNSYEKSTPISAATAQTMEIIKSANEWLQMRVLNIISLFKEQTEVVAVVDVNDIDAIKTIKEAKQLAQQGIKVTLVINKGQLDNLVIATESGNIAVDENNNLSYELINNDIKNLTIKSYESLDGDVDQLSSALDVISNIKGKKVLYVSNSIKGNAEDYEKAGILAQSSVSIGTAIAKGLINFKKDTLVDKVSNMVDNSNGIIASYDVEDSINDEDIANLTEQGISRIIIKTSEENIETAENKKQMLSKKGGIVDVMIVVVNENGSYRIEGEKDTQIVDYTQAQNMSVSELKNSIVYVNDAKNLVLGEKDIEKLTGVALAFDADIINSMEAKDTEKDGISMLSIVKLLVKQNNPEAKRNKAIIKGRNIVIENKIGDFKVEDFIEGGKAVITDKQLKDLKIEAKTSEEKEGIALGIIQTLELKKVYEVERLNINKERADAANELLTMLGEYRLLVKKSYADNNEDEITIEGSGSDYNEILSNLRDKLRSNESDKTATLEQIIKILLTDQLELEANIEELSDMDVRITQALLAAA